MKYVSTRGQAPAVSGSEAIIRGLAPDGGLYVPETFPPFDFTNFTKKSYLQMAFEILHAYFPEFAPDQLRSDLEAYRDKFESPEPADLTIRDDRSFLELFHGPTYSFKDMALGLLPALMKAAYEVTGRKETITILVATSGDTGSAALEGFAGVESTEIIVLYPIDGVSTIQKILMENVDEDNAHVFAIEGNFDHAQAAIKKVMNDPEMIKLAGEKGRILSSANSINIGRLLPQTVYYFFAYGRLVREGKIAFGDRISVSVPTGNFGDILAAIYAREMGLPLGDIFCASNRNKVLTDFIETGLYDTGRDFYQTLSPSMDILRSSNLERYLYLVSGGNSDLVSKLYRDLDETGSFRYPHPLPSYLKAGYADDDQTKMTIKEVLDQEAYLIDPHTAVACRASDEADGHRLIVSTASPYKFVDAVWAAVFPDREIPSSLAEKIQDLESLSTAQAPEKIRRLAKNPVEAKNRISRDRIIEELRRVLADESYRSRNNG